MTNERLLYCLNGVDERFILKADPAHRYVRPQFRLAALAACLCLVFGGIFAVVRQIVPSAPFDPSLPHVSLPETLSEKGGGGSGLGTYFDGDSLICSLLPDERELPEALVLLQSVPAIRLRAQNGADAFHSSGSNDLCCTRCR